ncbi:MAG: hypothetical protein JOZ39_01720 [Chloroflexi bacterium]|nr:hypothetical protein [Chloroflexota bacterium]
MVGLLDVSPTEKLFAFQADLGLLRWAREKEALHESLPPPLAAYGPATLAPTASTNASRGGEVEVDCQLDWGPVTQDRMLVNLST